MTYKLHMNGVITGSLNSFCLACDIFLPSQREATDHIGTSEHKKKSDAVQYSDKFQHEHIKKFKVGYYCEFCNVLMQIASKVNLHITEDEHKHNKGTLLLNAMGGDVVAFNNIRIEEKAWHGLIDGVCSLCNEEFEDGSDHKTAAGHCLNLVLKPIQFGADNAIFRHLDDTAVQCLTCNKLLAPGRMTKHFDDTEHHELYAKHRIETNGVCQGIDTKEDCQGSEGRGNGRETATNMTSAVENDGQKKKPMIDNDANKNSNEKSPTKDKSKILESIARYQSKGFNINFETETAFCKKCSEVVTFDVMEIEKHIENHSSAKAVDSDLLYPSNLDHNLNRVDIKDKTAQSSDDKQNTEVVHNVHYMVKASLDNIQNAIRNAKAASHEADNETDSSSSDDEFCFAPEENLEKCSQEEAPREFAKANKIIYNGENNQSRCRICAVNVPASLRSLKEHVEGANHKRLISSVASPITQPKTPGKQAKQSTREFVDKQNTEVVHNVHDMVKASLDNIQNAVRNAKAASHEADNETDSSSSDDEFCFAPEENLEKCSQEEAPREFAKANKITYNGENNQSRCRICAVNVPASLRSLKDHVEGASHKRLISSVASPITQPKTPGKQAKQSTREFVDSAYDARGVFSIINEEFCILRNSFYFISENSSRMRCIICEVNLPPYSDVEDHVTSRQHAIKWLLAPVIISEKKEFIREVRPGLYHCGYCHLIVEGWADMKLHLECSDHRDNRTLGENRMRFHYPNLKRFKMQKDMEAMAMMSLFNMFN